MQKISGINTARKYALAAYKLAVSKKTEAQWEKDLAHVAELFETKELAGFLKNPAVLPAAKLEAVGKLAKKKISDEALELAELLVRNKRTQLAGEVYRLFKEMVEAAKGVIRVDAVSAVPLGDKEKKAIHDRMKTLLGKEVHLETQVDPTILGGLVLRMGDHQVDGSLRTKLSRIKESLLSI